MFHQHSCRPGPLHQDKSDWYDLARQIKLLDLEWAKATPAKLLDLGWAKATPAKLRDLWFAKAICGQLPGWGQAPKASQSVLTH